MTVEVKFSAKAGEPYRQWRMALLNVAVGQTDDSGSSICDHLLYLEQTWVAQTLWLLLFPWT